MQFISSNKNIDIHEQIFQSGKQAVTHIVIPKGKEMGRHQAPFSVIVIPIKGKILFAGDNESKEITVGDIVQMDPNEPHSLTAIEDSEAMVIKSKLD